MGKLNFTLKSNERIDKFLRLQCEWTLLYLIYAITGRLPPHFPFSKCFKPIQLTFSKKPDFPFHQIEYSSKLLDHKEMLILPN